MEPIHVPRWVIIGHVVVEPGIDGPLAETQREGSDDQPEEWRRHRVAEEGESGHQAADEDNPPGPETPKNSAAGEAGDRWAKHKNDSDHPRRLERYGELPPHARPGDAKDAVGESQADEG